MYTDYNKTGIYQIPFQFHKEPTDFLEFESCEHTSHSYSKTASTRSADTSANTLFLSHVALFLLRASLGTLGSGSKHEWSNRDQADD